MHIRLEIAVANVDQYKSVEGKVGDKVVELILYYISTTPSDRTLFLDMERVRRSDAWIGCGAQIGYGVPSRCSGKELAQVSLQLSVIYRGRSRMSHNEASVWRQGRHGYSHNFSHS